MGRGPFECHCYNQVLEEVAEGEGSCGPEAAGKAPGGGEARPCNVSCFSVPVGKEQMETTEVGIQWVFLELWAVWLEHKGVFRRRVRTFLCLSLSPKLYF